MTNYDVAVIGGGAAGLSAAVALARFRRSVIVIDSGRPRNAAADGVHNFLSRDGVPPEELLAAGRAELIGYGGEIVSGEVRGITGVRGAFVVERIGGATVEAQRLIVATGLVDELPDIPGLGEQWGAGVVHCPYCHGWEIRDTRIGVLATGPAALHQVQLFRQLSQDVTLLRHTADLSDADLVAVRARGVRVVDGRVETVESAGGRLTGVRLRSGEVIPLDALAVAPRFVARSTALRALGLDPAPHETGMGEHVPSGPMGATSVPGVWLAGNVTDPMAQVMSSAADGTRAGAAANADLVAEEVERATA